jgi:hypothetical protein
MKCEDQEDTIMMTGATTTIIIYSNQNHQRRHHDHCQEETILRDQNQNENISDHKLWSNYSITANK